MIVYIESNFVLELAFVQEEHTFCESVLQLTERGEITLVLPTFCVAEPYETLGRKMRERTRLQTRLSRELEQIGRSAPYEEMAAGVSDAIKLLVRSGEEAERRLEENLTRSLQVAELVSIDSQLFAHALELQSSRSLGSQDAIVYAAVLRHLSSVAPESKCFLNRNSKDFLTPDIEADLSSHGCELIPSFKHGLRYIERQIEA